MSDQAINSALSTRLQSLGLPTWFENANFTPTSGVLYLAEAFLPRQTDYRTLEATGTKDYGGVYQVAVMAPRGATKGAGMTAAKQVQDHFPRGLFLTHSGVTVIVYGSYQSTAIVQGDRWMIPVSINYRAIV